MADETATKTASPRLRGRYRLAIIAMLLVALTLVGASVLQASPPAAGQAAAQEAPRAPNAECALLDDPAARQIMSGMFETRLLVMCGRTSELGGGAAQSSPADNPFVGLDVRVSDPTGESGTATTQSETSIAINEDTGTICSGYNDAYHGVTQGLGYTGYSRSTDGGATFDDRGPLGPTSFGDPSIFWRRMDGKFYFAALHSSGLGLWRSDDDCQTFVFVSNPATGGDDKELMAIDNNVGSPFYGRIYVVWTDFGSGAQIYEVHTDNGTTWSAQANLSGSGDVQGAYPAIAPNGDVYVSWVRWNPYPTGPIDIDVTRSTNGGVTWTPVTDPLSGAVNPRASGPTASCGRPALNANIRYLPSPQIAVTPNGNLHVVYSYDPDGFNTGDVVNVYYRRSTNNGTSWGAEFQLNDDGTTTDQFFPTVSAGPGGRVVASWYDRRLDTANNVMFDYFMRISHDGGTTWEPSIRVSDVSSPVYIDPNLAACYHGDYDMQIQDAAFGYIQWSDDRSVLSGHQDPDIWLDIEAFAPDFTISATPSVQNVCVPANTSYSVAIGSILGYNTPVTLSTTGVPAGYTPSFTTNPVVPPGNSTLNLTNSGGATAGSYNIDIIGNASGNIHETSVLLNLYTAAPGAPTLTAPANGATNVDLVPTFEWTEPAQSAEFQIQVATDSGFTNIVYDEVVDGSPHTISIALDPLTTYYWRVRGTNTCGNGNYSTTFSFTTRDIPPILLVDDDDNTPNVFATYDAGLNALGLTYDLWDTLNSDNEPTATDLLPYDAVIWFTGDEFGGFAGPGAAGETALSTWLDAGGCLMISSQDYHYDRGLTPFMANYLGAATVADDTGDYTSVTGQGSVFGGLGPYNLTYPFTDFSDRITATASAELAFQGNNGFGAAVDKDTGVYRTTFWTFPWEAISTAANREEALTTFLDWCGGTTTVGTLDGTVTDADSGDPIEGATITADDGGTQYTTTTASDGTYTRLLPEGTYDVTAEKDGYIPETVTGVVVTAGATTTQDFALEPEPVPDINVDPTAMSATLEPGGSSLQILTISNVGDLDLTWEIIEEAPVLVPAYVPPAASGSAAQGLQGLSEGAVSRPEGAVASSPAGLELLVDQQPNQVNGLFADSSCSLCGLGAQSIAENFSLPAAATIGQIVFWTGYYPGDVPLDTDQITVIFHQDAGGLPGASIYTEANVAYERVQTGVVLFGVHEWMHTLTLGTPQSLDPGNYWIEIYNNTGAAPNNDFFWETGNPDTLGNGLPGSGWTTATPGTSWNYDGATELAFQLVAGTGGCTAGDIPWVSADPTSGTTAGGAATPVDVTFDATGLTFGTYEGTLCVESNDPDEATVLVELTLTVQEEVLEPEIEVDPLAISETLEPGETVTNDVTIDNLGDADLNWTAVEAADDSCVAGDLPWASADPTAGTTAAGESSTVEVTFDATGLAVGTYEGTLCINSNDADEPQVPIALTLVVEEVTGMALYLPVVINAAAAGQAAVPLAGALSLLGGIFLVPFLRRRK